MEVDGAPAAAAAADAPAAEPETQQQQQQDQPQSEAEAEAAQPDAATVQKLRAAEQTCKDLEEANAKLETRETRLSERLLREVEKNRQLSQPEVEKKYAALEAEIRQLNESVTRAQDAEATATERLAHAREVEMDMLNTKVAELTQRCASAEASRVSLQEGFTKQLNEKEDELQQAFGERRAATVTRVEAQAEKEVCERRLAATTTRLEEVERAAEAGFRTQAAESRDASERDDELRRELRSLQTHLKAATGENRLLRSQQEAAARDLQGAKVQLQDLRSGRAHAEAERAQGLVTVERERAFLRGEIERLKAFVGRLEEGKTDEEIMRRLLGAEGVSVDQDALSRLAAAQRLVAQELDLSMSTAYSQWLDMRLRLEVAEGENARLVDSQQAVVEACETMAPSIFNQQRELQTVSTQLYRLQGHFSTLQQQHAASKRELAAAKATAQVLEEQLQAKSREVLETQQNLRRWSAGESAEGAAKEAIETEAAAPAAAAATSGPAAAAARLDSVAKRNAELEEKVSQLTIKVERDADSGLREREIEQRAAQKMQKVAAEHASLVQQMETMQDALQASRTARDNVLRLLYDYAVKRDVVELKREVTAEAGAADVSLKVKDGAEGGAGGESPVPLSPESLLSAEAVQQRASQLADLKAQLAEKERGVQRLEASFSEMTTRAEEAEALLRRERSQRVSVRSALLSKMVNERQREAQDVAAQKEHVKLLSDHHQQNDSLRAAKKSLADETHLVCENYTPPPPHQQRSHPPQQRESLEAEVQHLKAANESLEKHYCDSVSYSSKYDYSPHTHCPLFAPLQERWPKHRDTTATTTTTPPTGWRSSPPSCRA